MTLTDERRATLLDRAGAGLVGLATLVLTGCGVADVPDAGSEPSGGSSSGSASRAPRPTAQPVPPLTFVKEAPADACYALRGQGGDEPADVAWFASAVNVTASGRLVDVTATDADGVAVVTEDTQQVPLASRVDRVGKVGAWPLTADQVSRFILVRDAEDLLDVDLRANQTLLPVLHLEVDRGASVGDFVFTYELSSGRRTDVPYAANLSFPRRCGGGND